MKNLHYNTVLFLVCLFTFGCRTEKALDTRFTSSVAWMWKQQAEDGGWHSETHAVLRDGKALTPYILYYLLRVPDSVYPKSQEAIARAIGFITSDMYQSIVWNKDSIQELNYPNYSAAYALRVLYLTHTDTVLQKIIADHLLAQQFLEHRGIYPDQLAFGGWGYGEPDLPFGEYGHVDLSHTRRITEALMESHFLQPANESKLRLAYSNPLDSEPNIGLTPDNRAAYIALFLSGAQRVLSDPRLYPGCTSRARLPYDGGFVSSMATLSTNKCQPVEISGAGIHYPSYATATCDGLLAMEALGLKHSKAYADAADWLMKHQRTDVIDGLSPEDPEQWYLIMHYYHFSVRAEAMKKAGLSGPWEKEMRLALIREQKKSGFYINPIGGVNKEDDPLMSTIFCIQAMTALSS